MIRFRVLAPLVVAVPLVVGTGHTAAASPTAPAPAPAGSAYVAADGPDEARELLKSFIWWRLKGTKTAGNQGQASLQQKNVGFTCVSDERTGWGSTTLGTIVYGGHTYYARVYPDRVSLACGG